MSAAYCSLRWAGVSPTGCSRSQAEEAEHAAHELGLVLGEVVVDGDDVHALAGQRVEVGRQGRDESLALTGLHLGDVAEVQRGAAHDLDVEVPQAEGARGRLADGGESLRQDVVEGLALGEPRLEAVGLLAQLGVGERLEVVLERVDLLGDARQLLDDPAFTEAQDLLEDLHEWDSLGVTANGRSTDLPRVVER